MGNQKSRTMRAVVGGNVEKARRDMDLSQQALGARLEQWLGVPWSRQAVSLAELGKRAFGVDDLVGLSIGLRVSIRELLTPEPDVERIELASGMVVNRAFVEHNVIGAGADAQETQRSRYIGHLEEIDAVSSMLAERKEVLQKRLDELDKDSGANAGSSRQTDSVHKVSKSAGSTTGPVRDGSEATRTVRDGSEATRTVRDGSEATRTVPSAARDGKTMRRR